jgi:hypothetical protein
VALRVNELAMHVGRTLPRCYSHAIAPCEVLFIPLLTEVSVHRWQASGISLDWVLGLCIGQSQTAVQGYVANSSEDDANELQVTVWELRLLNPREEIGPVASATSKQYLWGH